MSLRINQQLEREVKYLASVPVGDGGYSDHQLEASALRAGVTVVDLRKRLRSR